MRHVEKIESLMTQPRPFYAKLTRVESTHHREQRVFDRCLFLSLPMPERKMVAYTNEASDRGMITSEVRAVEYQAEFVKVTTKHSVYILTDIEFHG